MNQRVIVTGTIAYDYIMDFTGKFADRIMPEKIHKLSLSFLVDHLSRQFGGTAGNIAYSLKLLGIDPLIVSPAGNDFPLYEAHLKKQKISAKYISVHKDVSMGSYFVITDQDDNQIGAFYAGGAKYAAKLNLSAVKEKVGFIVVAPTDAKAMISYARQAAKMNIPYLFDPAFQIADFPLEELREGITRAQILIGNDYEIALIEQRLEVSHEELRTMVPLVITTLAGKGSIIETRYESVHCAVARPDNTSDPTGAGDAFRAGFLAGYLRSYDLKVCGQMGSTAAVYTVEKYGTQTHTFTPAAFMKRYTENFGTAVKL